MGPDQLVADERRELCPGRAASIRRELAERLPLEVVADHGRTLEHVALLLGQPVEAGGEQRVDRRWHVSRVTALREHGEQLLDEERVPLRDLADPRARRVVERGTLEQVLDQLLGLALRQRLERHHLPAPRGPSVQQLGPGEAEEQQRSVPRPVTEMLGEVEQGRLRPVDVLHHECEWSLAGALLERLAHRPEHVLRRVDRERRLQLPLRPGLAEDLDERQVRDALAVRQAPAGEHGGVAGEHCGDLAREA